MLFSEAKSEPKEDWNTSQRICPSQPPDQFAFISNSPTLVHAQSATTWRTSKGRCHRAGQQPSATPCLPWARTYRYPTVTDWNDKVFSRPRNVLRVHGEDARSWLQGQLTADVRKATESDGVYGLFVNLQGRILADAWVLYRGQDEDGDLFDVVVPAEGAEALLEHLDGYIIMEDVELTLNKPGVQVAFGTSPEAPRCAHLGRASHFVFGGDANAPAAQWHTERLRLGVPEFGADFGPKTLPQEAGLKDAVAFDKGCYVGQEPIVMLEHRGKPPRLLVHLAFSKAPEVGTAIEAGEKSVGEITSRDGVHALAMIKRKALEKELPLRAGDLEAKLLGIVGQS